MALPEFNYGDTFIANCVYQDNSGAAVDLDAAGITVSAAIYDPTGTLAVPSTSLPVTMLDQTVSPGAFAIQSDSSTWQNLLGEWVLMIGYVNAAGIKWSTQHVKFYMQ